MEHKREALVGHNSTVLDALLLYSILLHIKDLGEKNPFI